MATAIPIRELKLHSPVGVEPAVFIWRSVERQVINIGLFSVLSAISLFTLFRIRKKMACLLVVMKLSKQFV